MCRLLKELATRELFPYFRGEQTLEEASESLKQATRRFAKRQLTWFRNRMQVTFYQIGEVWCAGPYFKPDRGVLND